MTEVVTIYGAWLVTVALALGTLAVWRSALLHVYVSARFYVWGYALFNNTIVLILALAWIVWAILVEAWYRQGADRGLLAGRAMKLLLGEAVFGGAGYAVYLLA